MHTYDNDDDDDAPIMWFMRDSYIEYDGDDDGDDPR